MFKSKVGFTFIEVLTALVIISIVSSIALPSLDNFFSSTRVEANAESFTSCLRKAKYSAIQQQALHRIIFHPDENEYKVQAYIPDIELGFPHSSDTNVSLLADAHDEYESLDWTSITDEDFCCVDSGVTIYKSSCLPQIIFIRPNGNFYYDSVADNEFNGSDISPLPECMVTFNYGEAAIKVLLNSFGLISSEAYHKDEDDDFENDASLVLW